LLGVEITLEGQKLDSIDAINALSKKNIAPIHILKGKYTFTTRKGENITGEIFYIKPNNNIIGFMQYLRAGDFCAKNDTGVKDKDCVNYSRNLYDYLVDNSKEINFPFEKTLVGSYDNRLIHAFFWLGKYIAQVEYPKYILPLTEDECKVDSVWQTSWKTFESYSSNKHFKNEKACINYVRTGILNEDDMGN
jgi:hypothetical protein